MKILGTVCARAGSKGVPRKNLKELCGTSLMSITVRQALSNWNFSNVVISTEDSQIANEGRKVCQDYRFAEIQMRPAALATDTASKWDVFRYIAECNPGYDAIVDLDTGCPLRAPEDITDCIEKLKTGYDVVVTAYEAERNPYFNMVRVSDNGRAWVVNNYGEYQNEPVTNRQAAPKVYSLSPSVFAIRTEALFNWKHWSQSNLGIVEIPRKRGIDIDTIEDFEYVEYLMRKDAK